MSKLVYRCMLLLRYAVVLRAAVLHAAGLNAAVLHAVMLLCHAKKKDLLQGYLIGNGVTDSSTDNINIFSLFSSWPLIPQTLAANLSEYECGTLTNPIVSSPLSVFMKL